METSDSEYDYIVIGSGSSGAVIASRLTEDGSKTVLLLEAGPEDNHKWMRVPIGFGKVLLDPKFMWQLATDVEPHLQGRSIPASRGKVLGGSSSVNGLVYVRGIPSDYYNWRQAGAVGWSYEDVLPYFRKAENQSRGEDDYHGVGGPVSVEDVRWRNELSDAFLAAAESIGLPRQDDFCRRDVNGVGYYQTTTRKGRRASTADGYLRPARSRPNLAVLTEAAVSRIEFTGREATAVRYEHGGVTKRAKARGEIILSAGSIASPQILQLSGIGPAAVLQQAGVPVIHALDGVGENMCDHLLVKRVYRTSSRHTLNAVMKNPVRQALAGARYALAKTGPLSACPATAGGFVRSTPDADDPDLQIFYHPFAIDASGLDLLPQSSFQITFYQSRPQSRGYVRIRAADPRHPPQIVANYLSEERDRSAVVAGMQLIGRIGKAGPLARFGAAEIDPVPPDDDALLDRARASSSTCYHHVGTCRIGVDAGSVVDPELRVHGVSKLRVADGSVMPGLISGNTNAACIMIGEKCADMVRAA